MVKRIVARAAAFAVMHLHPGCFIRNMAVRSGAVKTREKTAEITVFLTLLLSVLLSFILALVSSVRNEAEKLEAELIMDEALNSCFSEYSQELLKRFDLLYIDTGYRKGPADISALSEHLRAYIAENCKGRGKAKLPGISFVDAELKQYRLGSDFEGGGIMNQAVLYIKNKGGTYYLDRIAEAGSGNEPGNDEGEDFLREWDDCLAKVCMNGVPDNPAQRIRDISYDSSHLLLQGTSGILYKLGYSDVPSKRSLNKGTYPAEKFSASTDSAIFVEYLLQKLGCYTEAVGEQELSCELEYLLFGEGSDRENLKKTADRLMSHREQLNMRLILNSPDMLYEAERLAKESGAGEEATAALSEAIVYAWAYAEALIEVNRLLCGGRCEISASRSSFILPIEDLASFEDYLGSDGGTGFSYKEYLGIMLNSNPLSDNKRRFMDIVEMDMRRTENGSFEIDGLVDYIEAEGRFITGNGNEKSIKRAYAY
ncbi:MAG TPA: hypothetical protein DCL38_11130 [Lachnospiraceae bacterium]|nr:hypothetical protein [Lachnospiraceae bacterium]